MHPTTTPTAGTDCATVPDSACSQALQFERLPAHSVSELSDSELQAYIEGCAQRMLAAHARYQQQPHALSDAGEASYWWLGEREGLLERARRPHLVAAMEREQARRIALEPGAARI